MPIDLTLKFIGVGCVMPAIVKKQKNVLVVSLLYKDPDIKKEISVKYVDSKHNIPLNWMCSLWMEIYGIQQMLI
jgi:hypothetical protein